MAHLCQLPGGNHRPGGPSWASSLCSHLWFSGGELLTSCDPHSAAGTEAWPAVSCPPHTAPHTGFAPRHLVSTRASSNSSRSTRVCPNLSSGPRSPFPSLRFISGRKTRGNHVPMVGVASTLQFPLWFLPLSSKKLRVSSPEPWTGRGTLRVCTESGLWSQSLRLRKSCRDGFVFWKHQGASVREPPPPSASSSDITGLADEPYFQRKKFGLLVDINF